MDEHFRAAAANTRLATCLEVQLVALSRAVEALAVRVEAVAEELAVCRGVLGQGRREEVEIGGVTQLPALQQ